MDEFLSIATLFRPLAAGAPEALDLRDDAAVIPARPGFDLIVTKDAMVEGVHFLSTDPPEDVARKLLRVNLSDLAAKAADPYGYFLAVAWPPGFGEDRRARFAGGLAEDQKRYQLALFGGDTVSTPGPLTLCVTALGWVPAGCMVKRSGGKAGDALLVSGSIGDAGLGLLVAQGGLTELAPSARNCLRSRFHLPEPRLALSPVLRRFAAAAADVSDGLLADAGHVADASGLGLEIDLEHLPLSAAASLWAGDQPSQQEARLTLATAGDDYEIVLAVDPAEISVAIDAAKEAGVALTRIGRLTADPGLTVRHHDEPVTVERTGWSHP